MYPAYVHHHRYLLPRSNHTESLGFEHLSFQQLLNRLRLLA